jgi:Ni/Fe-hydrogenase subunit HybB-like protein
MSVRVYGRSIDLDPRLVWRVLRREVERTPMALRLWLGFLALLMLIGAVGAVRALFPGDKAIGTTATVEWGLLIVGYVFFAITTSGLCLASSLGTVFGIERFRPLEKRHAVLAVLCLVTAFGIIALDLHWPIRLMFGVVFNPSPGSAMWWMGVFYGAYLCFLLVEVWSIFWHHPRIHQWACLLSSMTAIVAPLTLGAVFAVVASRSLWFGVFTPLLMIAGAFVSGVSVLAIVFYLVGRLRLVGWERAISHAQPAIRLLLAIGLIAVGLLVGRQLIAGLTSADLGMRGSTSALLYGPLAIEFVGLRIVGGLWLPLLIVLLPWTRGPAWLFAAGILSIIGVFTDRFTFVIAGQIAPVTTVSGVVSSPFATYDPSPVEIAIIVGAFALVAFMYTLAERYLDLGESEAHTMIWLPAGATARIRALIPRRPQSEAIDEQAEQPVALPAESAIEPLIEPLIAPPDEASEAGQ